MGFRIATIIAEVGPDQIASSQDVGSEQWSAPEVSKSGVISRKADIFSFAMVMIEVRRRRSTTCRVWFDIVSHKQRYLLEKTPLTTSTQLWPMEPYGETGVHNDRRIQMSLVDCGD